MTKEELLKALEPFSDEIEIYRYAPNNLTDKKVVIESVNYKITAKGLGEITLE